MSFAKISPDLALAGIQNLTPTQYQLWTYLISLDWFGNGLEIELAELAVKLNKNADTIRKALNFLEDNNWLRGPIRRIRAYQRGGSNNPPARQPKSASPDTKTANPDTGSASPDTKAANPATRSASPAMRSASPDMESDLNCEAPAKCDFQQPQIGRSKDLKDLSESGKFDLLLNELAPQTRERFSKFCESKINNLPSKPALPKKWLDKYASDLWLEFAQKWEIKQQTQSLDNKQNPLETSQPSDYCKQKATNREQPKSSGATEAPPNLADKEAYAKFVAERAEKLRAQQQPPQSPNRQRFSSEDERQRQSEQFLEKQKRQALAQFTQSFGDWEAG
jgi:hypothetical protein